MTGGATDAPVVCVASPLVKLSANLMAQLLTWLNLPISHELPVTEEELKGIGRRRGTHGCVGTSRALSGAPGIAAEIYYISLRPRLPIVTQVEWIDITDSTAVIYRLIKQHP